MIVRGPVSPKSLDHSQPPFCKPHDDSVVFRPIRQGSRNGPKLTQCNCTDKNRPCFLRTNLQLRLAFSSARKADLALPFCKSYLLLTSALIFSETIPLSSTSRSFFYNHFISYQNGNIQDIRYKYCFGCWLGSSCQCQCGQAVGSSSPSLHPSYSIRLCRLLLGQWKHRRIGIQIRS